MAAALQRAWRRRGPLALLLAPASLLYGLLAGLHRLLYATGLRRRWRAPVPVVVVGNVVAGGAGKTPVVIALARHLRERGIACGVVSRGHGRSGNEALEVTPDGDPAQCGDEPLLIARHSGVPVVVGARRPEAVRLLLARHPGTQVVLSDDGLQHHALARDFEIVVFDDRGAGNGWLLPAGPLRERWPRRADLVLRTASSPGIRGCLVRRQLAPEGVASDGTRRPLRTLGGPTPCVAIAAIAQPEVFFAMLRDAGVPLAATYALPDHDPIEALPRGLPADATVLCTEKDAAKLWKLLPRALAVPLQVAIEPAFWDAVDRWLDARLSSPHGSQAA